MDSGPSCLQVYLRIRPPLIEVPREPRLCLELEGPGHVRLLRPGLEKDGRRRELETFSGFTSIFPPSCTQGEVFEGIMAPLVHGLDDGKSALLVAMGPTGAGKSHTVLGCDSHPGLLPRTLQLLFNSKEQQGEGPRSVRISMFEIYSEHSARGEKRRDLLEDTELTFLQSKVKEEVTSTAAEAIAVAARGMHRRSTASTGANDQSRHRLLNHPQFAFLVENNVSLIIADLAGCEREKQTGNQGVRLTESSFINNTSMVFGQCLRALLEHQKNPSRTLEKFYQNSLLTKYLKNYMEAKGRMSLIVNVSPREEDYFNTAFVLKQAAPFSEIRTSLALPTSQKKRPNPTSSRTWKRRCITPPTELPAKLTFEDPSSQQIPETIRQDSEAYYWKVVSKVVPDDHEEGEQNKLFSLREMEEALSRQKETHKKEISLAVAEALTELEQQHEARMIESQRHHEEYVSELVRHHRDAIRDLVRQHEESICQRETQYEENINQLQRLHAVASEVLKSQLQHAALVASPKAGLETWLAEAGETEVANHEEEDVTLDFMVLMGETALQTYCHENTSNLVKVEIEVVEAVAESGNQLHDVSLVEAAGLELDTEDTFTGKIEETGVAEQAMLECEADEYIQELNTEMVEKKKKQAGDIEETGVEEQAMLECEADGNIQELNTKMAEIKKQACDIEEQVETERITTELEPEAKVELETNGQEEDKELVQLSRIKVEVTRTNWEEEDTEVKKDVGVDADETIEASGVTEAEESTLDNASAVRIPAADHLRKPKQEYVQEVHQTSRHTPEFGRLGQQPKLEGMPSRQRKSEKTESSAEALKKSDRRGTTERLDDVGPIGLFLEELLGLRVREIENGLWHNVQQDAVKISELLAKHGGYLDVSNFRNHKLSVQKALCMRYLFALISKKGFANKRLVELSNCFEERFVLFRDIVRARTVNDATNFAKKGLKQDGLMKITGRADSLADGEEDCYKTPAAKLRAPGGTRNGTSRTTARTTSRSRKPEGHSCTAARVNRQPGTSDVKPQGADAGEKENSDSPKLSPATMPKRRWKLQPLSALNQRSNFQETKICIPEGETNPMWRGPGGSSSISKRLQAPIRNARG